MKFSVIIPCFNASQTISRALDSLRLQTFQDFEVVLVDDASNDLAALLKIVEGYRQNLKIDVLSNQINKNGAYSRNRGINASHGEYIAFLDADDTWTSTRLEFACKQIEKNPQARFVIYGRYELIGNHTTGALLPIRGIRKDELVSDYVFAAGQHMQTSTFVCPTDVAKEVLFDESLTRHQDSDFMMRAQDKGIKLIFEDNKCASYFFRSEDMRRRISSGRINSDFCMHWLKVKRPFFSKASVAGYMLSTYSRVTYMEGRIVDSLKMVVHSLAKIGWRNICDLIQTKVLIIYKTRLGL